MTHHCLGNPEPDAEYTFEFTEEYIWKGKISKFNPPFEIEYTMTEADENWKGTKVGCTLKETKRGTRISFYHTGWESANDHFRQTSFCWAMYLRILKKFVEEGHHIPYAERNNF